MSATGSPHDQASLALDSLVASNKAYWPAQLPTTTSGRILIDAMDSHPIMVHGVVKVGLIWAKILGFEPTIFTGLRTHASARELSLSMCPRAIDLRRTMLARSIIDAPWIARTLTRLRTGDDVLGMEQDGLPIGEFIYDGTLRALAIPSIQRVTPPVRRRIALELAYFRAFRSTLDNVRPARVVLSDSVYRHGMMLALCRERGIPAIVAINLNDVQMRKCETAVDHAEHCRQVERGVVDRVRAAGVTPAVVDEYFARRFAGKVEQHDVRTAYASTKIDYSRSDLDRIHRLDPGKPLVVVMAHVFSDAPHSNPGLLFRDYEEWLDATIGALRQAQDVEFLVKEHPSSALYGERGIVDALLARHEASDRKLVADANTRGVLRAADIVVTAGGTVAMEFACQGKPVVVASRPLYAGFGFTHEPPTRDAYVALLRTGLGSLQPLSPDALDAAKLVSFVSFELYDNWTPDLEFGGRRFVMGDAVDDASFYSQLLTYNAMPLDQQRAFRLLADFAASPERSLINWGKVERFTGLSPHGGT